MIVSVAQFCPRLATSEADVRDNARRAEPLLHRAWRMGSELVVFPELCFTGYSFLSPADAARVCERADGPTFRLMQQAAIAMKAYVAWGYVESDGSRLYNSATLVGPDGRALTAYRKVNLFSSDFLWARPGDRSAAVVETELGRMSVVVCRDLRDKVPANIPRTASEDPPLFDGQTVDVVAALTNWGKGGFPPTTWMDFVADNECVLAATNRWGKETVNGVHGEYVQDFGQGGAAVIEPDWTVHIDGLVFREDCVVTAAIEGRGR